MCSVVSLTVLYLAIIFQVLVAILPQTQMQYFDIQTKMWKPLSSMAQLPEAIACFCSEVCGNYLYVATRKGDTFVIDRYHISLNIWETLPSFCSPTNQIGCLCSIEDHIYAIYHSEAPRRFSIPKNQWQCVAKLSATLNIVKEAFCNKSAVVFKSCIYVLHGVAVNRANSTSGVQHSNVSPQLASTEPIGFSFSQSSGSLFGGTPTSSLNKVNWQPEVAVMYCFDPKQNAWEQKASTKKCHFASSLFVVNDKLFVGGGKCSVNKSNGRPSGERAAVEVYDEENNSWSVVDQSHIPPNNLGAVEIEGRVYFIINCFPFDSGIRIPPEDVYPVSLDEWENLGKINGNAVLCYLPIKVDKL